MKKLGVLMCLLAAAAVPAAFANGLNLNGIGTKAVTMGGAFVGLADDFSALYWNPAGIAFLTRPTFGFNLIDVMPSASYRVAVPGGGIDAESPTKHYLGGLGGWIQPVNDRLTVAVGISTPSGLGSAWEAADMAPLSGGLQTIDWSSRIGVFNIAPTAAYKVSDSLSFGAQLNIYYGSFALNTYAGSIAFSAGRVVDLGQYEETLKGWGFGASLGALFKPVDTVSIGLAYRTASTIKYAGDATISMLEYIGYNPMSGIERPVTLPAWMAAGVAVKPAAGLTITADVQHTNWKTLDVLDTTYDDDFWELIMTASGNTEMKLFWENRTQIRVGAEYAVNPSWTIRAGYYNDPSPAPDRTMNILLPSFDFNALTFGAGRNIGDLRLDFGAELLFGSERTIAPTPENITAMPGVYGMTIIVPHLSISYGF